ncbi:MAG TPA: FHA domain-containing protein [Anaerolineales bacterium]|nr:FHA domain-containing protein [Anaerolineales bacterium]
MHRSIKFAGLVLAFLYLTQSVSAQVSNLVKVSAPDTEEFPTVSSYFEVRDEAGNFVSGLTAGEVTVLENEQRLPVDELTELEPGVQWVVAINPSTTFAPRDSQGKSRYDDVVETLMAWATSSQGKADDLNLLMNGMEDVTHVAVPSVWAEALAAAPADHRSATSNIQILSRAIGLAASQPARIGMGQAVLFITPHPERDEITALQSLGEQARNNNVRLFIWMVTSEAYFTQQGALALQEIAFSTGGQFFAYSGTEEFPSLETYLEPLRHIYTFKYSSQIVTQGEQSLSVEIETPTFVAASTPLTFPLDILPPNPILVSPPGELYRSILTDARTNQMTGYTNEAQDLEILIEFPDGYERPLARTTLYVNGKIADENTEAPFEHFTWNLSDITASGRFELQVEAVDTRGMSSISLPNTVDITVQQLPQGFAAEISRQGSYVSAAVVLVSGAVLIVVLVMVMRRRHQDPTQTGQWKKRKLRKWGSKDKTPPRKDADAQRKARPGWAQFPWTHSTTPTRGRAPDPVAYLERVYDSNSLEAMTPTQPIPILNNVVTLGTDPTKATLILDEPSIAAQHARLRRDREGNFFVLDHGTVAGTWINYTMANGKEIRLQHGDLIHLGRVGYRFRMKNPPKAYEPVIEFEDQK